MNEQIDNDLENKKLKIDVIIPVYNEGANIENNLDALQKGIDNADADFTVYIVYDFDEDNTVPIIENIKLKYNYPLILSKNNVRGVINAIKHGFKTSQGDFALVTMADMSDDYEILTNLIELAKQGNDVICGSRYMQGGKLYGGPFFKQLLSRMAGLTMNWFTSIPTKDITNSYKLYRKSLIEKLTIESIGGFEIGMEVTAKAYLMGYKVVETPSRWWDRTEGTSKFKLFSWLPRYLKWYFYLIFNEKKSI